MIPSALHLPTGEEERSKGNPNETNTGKKQSRNKQFPELLSKRKGGKSRTISLYESRQSRRGFLGDNSTAHGVLKNQVLLGRWCSFFLPSLSICFPIVLYSIQSFREGRGEREREGKGVEKIMEEAGDGMQLGWQRARARARGTDTAYSDPCPQTYSQKLVSAPARPPPSQLHCACGQP